MRKQYHFRPGPAGLRAWDVDRLVERTRHLAPEQVPLAAIREVDEPYWAGDDGAPPTCRDVLAHAQLIVAADLRYPIILSADGRVMDGMHRVLKALWEGRTHVAAVRFTEDPAPDYVGLAPDDLPY